MIPVPVYLVLRDENNLEKVIYKSPLIWSKGNRKIIFEQEVDNKIISIKLGNSQIPDINKTNNTYRFY